MAEMLSITTASEVLKRDRATLRRALEYVPPDRLKGNVKLWTLANIHSALLQYEQAKAKTKPAPTNGSTNTNATARLKEAQAELVETKNAKQRGELLAASEVEREWTDILRGVRAGMLALPSRVQQRCPGITANIVREITSEVAAVLNALGKDEEVVL